MKVVHYIMLASGALAGNLAMLFDALPPAASPFIKGAIGVAALTTTVLGIVSGSALPPKPPAPGGAS